MTRSRVAVIKTEPSRILEDYDRLLQLGGVDKALAQGSTTILKDNISWHFPYLSANTTPWQLEGTIRSLQKRGFTDLVSVHNNTVVTDPYRGEKLNKLAPLYAKYHVAEKYNFKSDEIRWIQYVPKAKMLALDKVYPRGIYIPEFFVGKNIVHLPTVKTHIYTTTTGAMKNAFGGLLNEHRHWTHPVIHQTLVDLLMIQKKIHRGVFAVMDGTFAGDGPGPRCMIPHVKNVMLASADQVAIDAVAAKLMGFDPLSIQFIKTAHELGLGVGDPAEIEIVGDADAARENWHFVGPFDKMTFASRMQHKIYWGPLKGPIEWSLKTWLAPWAYVASVLYHDSFWYPLMAKRNMREVLASDWGRLFRNWEALAPDAQGWPDLGEAPAEWKGGGWRAFAESLRVLATCVREAPEIAARRRRALAAGGR